MSNNVLDKIKNKDLDWDNSIVFYNKNNDPETIFALQVNLV